MADSVVFRTPGHLDLRGITTFGINSKPNSVSPIGFFGTGLKYAIAIILREGLELRLQIGSKAVLFETHPDSFRDKDFQFIDMIYRNQYGFPKRTRLPFTTELGKNWKLWQAFRELYSNTLDENGDTYLQGETPVMEDDFTTVTVTGEAFVQEFREKDKNFLPDGVRNSKAGEFMQVLDRPSSHIYYRGMRVKDLRQPSVLTYNILAPLELTEDRTAKYDFYVDNFIKMAVVKSNSAVEIEKVLRAEKETYEHSIDYKDFGYEPSDTFKLVTKMVREKGGNYNHSAYFYARDNSEDFKKREAARHFTERMADFAEQGEWDKFKALAEEHQQEVVMLLRASAPYQPGSLVFDNPNYGELEGSGSNFDPALYGEIEGAGGDITLNPEGMTIQIGGKIIPVDPDSCVTLAPDEETAKWRYALPRKDEEAA